MVPYPHQPTEERDFQPTVILNRTANIGQYILDLEGLRVAKQENQRARLELNERELYNTCSPDKPRLEC